MTEKAAPQVPDSGPAARKFLRCLPYSSGMVMHSRRSRRQVSSHHVSRSMPSGAMMGISASVSPLAGDGQRAELLARGDRRFHPLGQRDRAGDGGLQTLLNEDRRGLLQLRLHGGLLPERDRDRLQRLGHLGRDEGIVGKAVVQQGLGGGKAVCGSWRSAARRR